MMPCPAPPVSQNAGSTIIGEEKGFHVRPTAAFSIFIWFGVCVFAFPAHSQITQEETLSGPDSHEMSPDTRAYLFGDWGGWRTRLLNRGVRFDFQYISDSLWNVKSEKKKRFAMWNRFRATVAKP